MNSSKMLLSLGFATACLLFQNCARSGAPDSSYSKFLSPFSTAEVYFRSAPKISLEVHYETGAEPFVGANANGRAFWNITEENLRAVFQYRSTPPVLGVPKELNEMHPFAAQNKTQWTSQEILDFANAIRKTASSESDSRFQIIFLNGHLDKGNGPEQNVIGVQIGEAPVIAIFKPVIRATAQGRLGIVPKFVEQSTIVHEMGHALGFVNHGVPMSSQHEDTSHPAHTTNSDCVMYWLNEGSNDLAQFVQKYIASNSVVMWGPEVLADAQSFSR